MSVGRGRDSNSEDGVRLSQSPIWSRQRDYYIQRGLQTWTADKVPEFITNNPFIAEIYARIVFGFISDCLTQEHPPTAARPLRIVELGAGTGKFGYLFLRHFQALLRAKEIPQESFHYTMTDCSERILQSWRSNSYFAEFVNRGVLDFALLKAGADESSLEFLKSAPGPLVVIANYVFDSLPQDAFLIRKGELLEWLLTVFAAGSGTVGLTDSHPLSKHAFSFQAAPVTPERYSDPTWNSILNEYRKLGDATVLFPSAALKLLEQLRDASDGRIMVLAADKGFVSAEMGRLAQGPPALEWHTPECFSLMVNFDGIGRYVESKGGEALLPDKRSSKLHICGFLTGRPGEEFTSTRKNYHATQEAFGPDDLFTLFAWLNAHMEEMTVAQILAALRLTRWDPVALIRLFPVLGKQIRSVVAEREDLRDTVHKVWANLFPASPGDSVLAFDCGVILLELRYFEEAAAMFKTSQQVLGPSATTSYNLGLCAMGLEHTAEALAQMKEACRLDANFEPARAACVKLETQLQKRGP